MAGLPIGSYREEWEAPDSKNELAYSCYQGLPIELLSDPNTNVYAVSLCIYKSVNIRVYRRRRNPW